MSDNLTIEQRVKDILINRLNAREDLLIPEASILDDLGADSLDVVELIMAV